MENEPNQNPYQNQSLAHTFSQLNQPIRRKIIKLLATTPRLSFKEISERLELDRAALAYHLRLLRNAALIDNFYENQEGSKQYSYYKLTEFARWLLNHDLNLSLESQRYQPHKQPEESLSLDENRLEETDSVITSGTGSKNETSQESILDEPFEVKKDPRVRYRSYRITLK
jgi:predicted transcriptional regulator